MTVEIVQRCPKCDQLNHVGEWTDNIQCVFCGNVFPWNPVTKSVISDHDRKLIEITSNYIALAFAVLSDTEKGTEQNRHVKRAAIALNDARACLEQALAEPAIETVRLAEDDDLRLLDKGANRQPMTNKKRPWLNVVERWD